MGGEGGDSDGGRKTLVTDLYFCGKKNTAMPIVNYYYAHQGISTWPHVISDAGSSSLQKEPFSFEMKNSFCATLIARH